jgi:hypothetical protein
MNDCDGQTDGLPKQRMNPDYFEVCGERGAKYSARGRITD